MKSERRHELEKNELADWLAKKIEAIKPYQNAILGGTLLLVVVLLAYGVYARKDQAEQSKAWNALYVALSEGRPSPASLDKVAEDYPDTAAANWATVMAGDLYFGTGSDMLFSDKASARVDLTEAQTRYEKVLDSCKIPMLQERATYGLARALEAQGVDLKEATSRYEQVDQKWPNGAYAAAATQRAEDLNRKSTKWMYDQFAKYEPAAQFENEPGIPGSRLDFDSPSLLPDDPGFGDSPFKGMRDEGGGGTSSPLGDLTEPALPGPAEPEATDATPPATETPDAAAEPAADGAPAAEDDAATAEPVPTADEPVESTEPPADGPETAEPEETTGQDG